MRRLVSAAIMLAAAGPYVDPHDVALDAAAVAALPRARILAVNGRVVDVLGIASATSGRVVPLRDIAAELRAAGLLVAATDRGLRVTIPDTVLFDFDKATLRPDAQGKLAALAAGAAKVPALPVAIEGHTDAKGTAAYNARLSQARADAVRAWLAGNGVAPARLAARGFGATRPVAPNTSSDGRDDPAGRQKNRRVEIVIGSD